MSFFDILRPLSNILGFATFKPSATEPEQRIAISQDPTTNLPGAWLYRPVPPAILGPGVADEGVWPRFVVWDGESVQMTRDEWDTLKLSSDWECVVPSVNGIPIARLKGRATAPEEAAKSSPFATSAAFRNPSSPAASLKSTMSIDLTSPGPSFPRVNVPLSQSLSYMSVDTVVPAQRANSSAGLQALRSYMSVDTVMPADRMSVDRSPGPFPGPARRGSAASVSSVASDTTVKGGNFLKKTLSRASSATAEAKNNGRKRAHHHLHQHKAARATTPEAKRVRPSTSTSPHPMAREPSPPPRKHRHRESVRAQRQRERAEYHIRRRELAQQVQLLELMAEAAHWEDLMQMKTRLAAMDAEERAARVQEEARLDAVRLQQKARLRPTRLNGDIALLTWVKRFDSYSAKRKTSGEKKRIEINDIPLPVLFAPPYSLTLVTHDEVAAFFEAIRPVVVQHTGCIPLLKKLRVELHPDRWANATKRCKAPEGCEAELGLVEQVMNNIMMWVNPNMDRWIAEVRVGTT